LAGKGSIAPFFTRSVSLGLLAFIAAVVFYQYLYPLIRHGRKKDRTVILK